MIDISTRLARALCNRRNTGQCAAICLSHLSYRRECPEAPRVFREDVAAVLKALTYETKGRNGSALDIYDALSKSGLAHSALSWGGFNLFGDNASIEQLKILMHQAGLAEQFRKEFVRVSEELEKLRNTK